MKVISIVGVRPNFMKIAPIHRAFLAKENVESLIIHTGQHNNSKMSSVFFEDLNLPQPNYSLAISGETLIQRLADVLLKLEPIIETEKPNLIIVVGDVTSTLGGALVANKMKIKLAHIEAGLRSFDSNMPEENNRILTDKLSNYLFATEESGVRNLLKEGIVADRIHLVGNVMIDSLLFHLNELEEIEFKLEFQDYFLLTMHRPSNVDNKESLDKIISIIDLVTKYIPVVFPLHPRTRNNLEKFGLLSRLINNKNIKLIEPQRYLRACLKIKFRQLGKRFKIIAQFAQRIQDSALCGVFS